MADLTNYDLLFCPADACRREGRITPLALASVGFLSRLRAVSYSCPTCGHVTAVSLRRGALATPSPGRCWNCAVPFAPGSATCDSCSASPDLHGGMASGVFFTFPPGELQEISDEPRAALLERLRRARAEQQLVAALRAADALTHRHPGDAALWRLKSDLYLEHGYLPLALHACKRALALEPQDVDTRFAFANVLELLDEIEEAVAVVEGIARQQAGDGAGDPGLARAAALLASLYEKLERFDDAAESARRAVAIDPGRADAWGNLATLHMRKSEFGEAIEAWTRVLESAPGFPLAWRYRGLCHLALKQWPEARAAGERAGDDDEEALELVFEALLGAKDEAGALAHAERAVARYPGSVRFLYLVARADLALGRHPEGLAACDEILRLDPGAEWAKKARAMFAARLG